MDTRYPGKENGVDSESRSYQQELEDLSLILFLLQTFKMADEEIQQMHMPLFLAAAVRKLEVKEKTNQFLQNCCQSLCVYNH